MPVVPFKGDHSHHATATSDDDADYEEDDEITGIVQPRPNFGSVEQKNRNMLVNRQEFDREDVEMMMDFVEKAEEFAPDLLKKEDERSSYSHRKVENRKKLGRMKKYSRYAQLDRRNTASGSDEDMESIASIGENEDDESKESSDSDPEEQWASEPEDDDEIVNPNCCIYCHQDEENDPSEEFELYLSCGVCGDNAHRQCARDADALKSEDEGTSWYCSECVSNDLVRNASFPEGPNKSPRKVVSRNNIAFNLLKSQRDKTTNDSRFLRKRKNSPCTDTISEDLKMPRRRARHQERGLSCVKNLAPDRDGLAGRQIELDTAESHSGHHTSNDHSQRLETNAEAFILRSIRPKLSSQPRAYATISEKSTNSLKILIKVDPLEIRNRLSNPPKPKEKSQLSVGRIPVARLSTFAPLSYPHPFYLSHDREADELKSKPYGGILTEKEADTSLTLPKPEHRRQFDEARQKAEEDWKARAAAAAQAAAASGIKKPRKVSGPASQIEYIEFGDFQIDIWYAAPYPEEYSRNKALFICEYCLKYMESDIVAWRHTTKCPWKNPPGDEIYRDGQVAVFEVDGRKNPLYCQNLCLLAKLFLGSKTLYYDVEPFLFYVMTEYDKYGCHFVGYFSKEKRSSSLNNVSCILVLPIHQRKGYGHLLIDFSYLLTRVEKKTGSPEKPLSDMGLVSYRNYWRLVLCKYLKDFRPGEKIPSIRKISSDMGLSPDDVISALDALGALVRDPITGTYAIKIRPDYFQQVIQNHESKNYVKLNPDALFWTPYVMGRWNTSNIDYTPTLETTTQPEEEQPQTSNITPSPGNKRDFRSFSEPQIGPNSFSGVIETPYLSQFTAEICTDSRPKIEKTTSKLSYYEAAALIPPTRFEVFPPPSGSRTRAAARNPSARQSSFPSPGSRLTPRRFEGSSRSTPCSKPQGKSGQRVSEGSGRGSGRWPREITKADGDLKEDQLSAAQRSRCEGHSGRDLITTERGGKGEGVGAMGQSDQGALGKRDVRVAAVMLDSSGGPQRRDRHVGHRSALGKPCLEGSGLIAGKGTAPTLASASGLPPLPRSGADADVEMPDMSAAPSDADQVMKMDVDVVDRIFN